jgi:hypothetical protein
MGALAFVFVEVLGLSTKIVDIEFIMMIEVFIESTLVPPGLRSVLGKGVWVQKGGE